MIPVSAGSGGESGTERAVRQGENRAIPSHFITASPGVAEMNIIPDEKSRSADAHEAIEYGFIR